jgi:hypothetical protein
MANHLMFLLLLWGCSSEVPAGPSPILVLEPPELSVNVTSLDFGYSAIELVVPIVNEGDTPLNWTASSNAAWVTFSVPSGQLPAGSSQEILARVSRSTLSTGSHSALIQISSNGGSASVATSLDVLPGIPSGPSERVNVRDFGARGDGLHDDTQAFISAANSLEPTGGELYVPSGEYVLSPSGPSPRGGLELFGQSNITLVGDGLEQTTIRMAANTYDGNTHLVYIKNSLQVVFRDLTIDGNRENASFPSEQNHCVEVWSSIQMRFERVRFRNCRGDGIRLMGIPTHGDPWTELVWIENSRFEDNGRSGIAVQRAVRNLHIRHNTFDRMSDQSIDVEPTGSRSPTDIFIENNVIRHTNATLAVAPGGIGGVDVVRRLVFSFNRIENGGAQFAKINDLRIEGNTIIGDPSHATLRLTHNVTNAVVIGNEFVGAGGSELPVVEVEALNGGYPSHITLQGNRIDATGGRVGIRVTDALGSISILQNEIRGGEGSPNGIHIENILTKSSPRSTFYILGNVLANFKNSIQFSTRGDAFGNVIIQGNTISHNQQPRTETVGILFNETGSYEAFAIVVPNSYGAGITLPIFVRN